MKRLFLFSCLMFIVTNIMAYQSMIVDGYSWNIVYVGEQMWNNTEIYSTNTEKIEGDSIINGIVYKKLWEAYNADLTNRQFLALIREDTTEQKVFAYNDGAEVLLYDLGVEVGDTIRVFDWLYHLKYVNSSNIIEKEKNLSRLVVEKIEFVEDEKYGTLKKITYYKADTDYPRKTTIYERYGSSTGWAATNHAKIDGMGPGQMICAFDENSELVFKQQYTIKGYGEVEDCYIKAEVKTDIDYSEENQSNIFYNAESRTLAFDVETAANIVLYDAMGKMVVNTTLASGIKSLPLALNSGIYIVSITTDSGQTIRTKIVVK